VDKKLVFFSGRHPHLSYLELVFALGEKSVQADFKNGLCYVQDPDLSVEYWQNRLGGVIKIAELVLDGVTLSQLKQYLIENTVLDFGINYLGKGGEMRFLAPLLKEVKKGLGKNSRFYNANFHNLNSVQTANLLKKKGEEWIIWPEKETFKLARTLVVQDVDAYRLRDYEKPVRDAKIGMLPPKLAQMLVNIAGEVQTIWDPFCGTGTILQEGVLMGKKVIGSDLNPQMVKAAKQNLQSFNSAQVLDIFQHDAGKFLNYRVDAQITESYLGPIFNHYPNLEELHRTDAMLSVLYEKWLANAARARIPLIVTCVPVYRMRNSHFFMEKTLAVIAKSLYNLSALTPVKDLSLVYSRPDQFVAREIVRLELKN